MPASKYEQIYQEIRDDIISHRLEGGEYLPSENSYCAKYGCTRNTIRRAVAMLTQEGFVLPKQGKGVQVIYSLSDDRNIYTVGGIESFAETAHRNQRKVETNVITFKETVVDSAISLQSGFDIGTEIYYIERIRVIDDLAMIFDTNIYLKSEAPGLSREIAAKSVYAYLEDTLNMVITISRRRITAVTASRKDKKYLDLDGNNFVLCVEGQVFNSKGIMFEYTQSRHVPDRVCFVQTAIRQKSGLPSD